jgi:hypothetical protein
MHVSGRVWVMARNVAQGVPQDEIFSFIPTGIGESCWGGIGVLVEHEINIANRSEDIPWG